MQSGPLTAANDPPPRPPPPRAEGYSPKQTKGCNGTLLQINLVAHAVDRTCDLYCYGGNSLLNQRDLSRPPVSIFSQPEYGMPEHRTPETPPRL